MEFLERLYTWVGFLEKGEEQKNIWSPSEQQVIDKIKDIYLEKIIQNLLTRPQIPQKTPEWYRTMNSSLSASEIGNIFSENSRKHMIHTKLSENPPFSSSAIESINMSAFDWGNRFEPLVKKIYEHKHSTVLKDLGKIYNTHDSKYCASPDGIICSGEKKGHLIEIKCPVTRKKEDLPIQYYHQVQMQLHVTGVQKCEYIEARFYSSYSKSFPDPSSRSIYSGVIYIVSDEETCKLRYEYGPLDDVEWIPELGKNDIVIEKIPWKLYDWYETTIQKNKDWWEKMSPFATLFWDEFTKAKEKGSTFIEQNRKKKRKPTCMIKIDIKE